LGWKEWGRHGLGGYAGQVELEVYKNSAGLNFAGTGEVDKKTCRTLVVA